MPVRPRSGAADVLCIAACLGLVSGLLEGGIVAVIRVVPGWITWQMRTFCVSADILWIAPIVDAALFVVAAVGLVLVLALARRLVHIPEGFAQKVAVLLFAALTFYAAVAATGRIYSWAACFLAVGLAVQFSRWFGRRQGVATGWLRRSLIPLAGVVVVAAAAVNGWGRVREAMLLGWLPATRSDRPNVLLLVFDTLRADHLSSYGYARRTTPYIDAIAEQGVLFENAIAAAPWTVPSHASMLTGLPVYQHQADGVTPVVGTRFPLLAEYMMTQGYLTGGFAANTWWITRDSGFDRGFVHFEDYTVAEMVARTVYGKAIADEVLPHLGYWNSPGRKTADGINRAFLAWRDANRGERPFFAFLNYIEVHGPYIAPAPYQTQFMDENQRERAPRFTFHPPQVADNTPPGVRAMLQAGYDGSLAYLDAQVGRLFAALQTRGLLDNTLVILTSDHGEAFGEHGYFAHGNSLYADQLHVPLIVRFPGRMPTGLRVATPVSLCDIPVTVVSALFPETPAVFAGSSLASHWSNAPVGDHLQSILSESLPRDGLPKAWPVSQGWIKSLVTPRWHFIAHEVGQAELYDRQSDPRESQNLVDTPSVRDVVKELQGQLTLIPTSPSAPTVSVPFADEHIG